MADIEDIKALADLQYAAQTTGVSTATLNAAVDAVGIDSSDGFSYIKVQELLESYGYAPGTSDFYSNSTTGQSQPDDEGLAIHYNAVQTAKNEYGYLESTEANMEQYGGKIDPTTGELYKFMVNDNVANAQLIQDGIAAQGIDVSTTVASTPSTTSYWQAIEQDKYTEEYDRQNELLGGDLDNSLT